ncbi:MAG: argininosuccinate lyase [Sarcosagium campestre]|nr:MAG: argininosuccinate lyase [Sarcosagium campestre]
MKDEEGSCPESGTYRASLTPYIRSRQECLRIRRILSIYLAAQIDTSGSSHVSHGLALTPHDFGPVPVVPPELSGLRKAYLQALQANAKSRDNYDSLRDSILDSSGMSAESEASLLQSEQSTETLHGHIGLLRQRQIHARLKSIGRHSDKLSSKPASQANYLDTAEIFKSLKRPLMPEMNDRGSLCAVNGNGDIANQMFSLEKAVLRAKHRSEIEKKKLKELMLERDLMTNRNLHADRAAYLTSLEKTRNEVIHWIESELALTADSPQDPADVFPPDNINVSMTQTTRVLESQYTDYLEARKSLVDAMTSLQVRPKLAPPRPLGREERLPDISHDVEEVPSRILLPMLDSHLLPLSSLQKSAIQHKSHLVEMLAKQQSSLEKLLERLSDESHLLPEHPMKADRPRHKPGMNTVASRNMFDGSKDALRFPTNESSSNNLDRIRAWAHASNAAMSVTRSHVASQVSQGHADISKSEELLREVREMSAKDERGLEDSAFAADETTDIWASDLGAITSKAGHRRLKSASRKNTGKGGTTNTRTGPWSGLHGRLGTGKSWRHARTFASTLPARVDSQEAPTAQAYLSSGAIARGRNRVDVKKVLVIGSGGLSIGQAGEFDYSGSQALKALKEAGVASVLVNPNIATIQTAHVLADEVYYLPVTPEYVTYVIERERPDGIFLTFGGQTALNLGVNMEKMGIFERYGVKVLGTSIKTLETSEDRDLFAKALNEINIPIAESIAVGTSDEAVAAAAQIGYPIIVRSAYALGGLGSGFASNEEELRNLSSRSLTLSPQILVERSLKGWKEVEYEVVRDGSNNCITVCNMENFDPLGIHTGDSIVVAPSQTLSDEEYHMLRTAAIKIVRHLGVVGECNVQYALQPDGLDYRVIEVNARLSRSSALASKATGYPLAYTAAKIGLGHTLPELPNAVTRTTTANFEPSLDYIVTKIPRWDLGKFQHVKRDIGSSMKSVGEVMAIGRTFEESIQKAIRQVDPRYVGFQGDKFDDLDETLRNPTDRRWLAVGQAMLHEDYSVDRVHELTKIDKWFLYKLQNIVDAHHELEEIGSLFGVNKELMTKAKKMGFSDLQIAKCVGSTEDEVRARRKGFGVRPFVKKIDTLAAEFPADTNYLYTTYNATSHDVTFDDHGIVILGSGVYRIGSSVEFDWCAVNCTLSLKEIGKKTVMINYNPETYSTDFDTADKLYFEELSYERVMDIYELEAASGVVVSVGGQLPQNIALRLQEKGGAKVLGTDPKDIDKAEDRHKFSQILDDIGVDQPAWEELSSVSDAQRFAEEVGYPVLVRPSYVLSGAAMSVIRSQDELKEKLLSASQVSPDHPVVITKFIEGAQEIDVDAVASAGKLIIHAVSEHVEAAGVHSGDATLILPPAGLDETTMVRVKEIAEKVAKAWSITGPFNMQIIKANSTDGTPPALKVIECNLRASRSFPFVSKVLGTNFIDVAAKALAGREVPEPTDLMAIPRDYVATKVPQFSWTRLAGADPYLGVEMSSTGEIASFGKNLVEAYWTSLQSTMNFRLPQPGEGILLGGDTTKPELAQIVRYLAPLGYKFLAASDEVRAHVESSASPDEAVSASVIEFPKEDKSALREVFQKHDIRGVFNLASQRASSLLDEDYVMRRNAVDFGVPLFMEPKTAVLFAQCMSEKLPKKEGIPGEVRRWSEFIGGKPL